MAVVGCQKQVGLQTGQTRDRTQHFELQRQITSKLPRFKPGSRSLSDWLPDCMPKWLQHASQSSMSQHWHHVAALSTHLVVNQAAASRPAPATAVRAIDSATSTIVSIDDNLLFRA